MASAFWINAMHDYTQVLGLPDPALTLILMSIAFSIFMGTFLAITTKNKDAGLFGFFGTYVLCALIGLVDWLLVAIPLISIAFIYFYFRDRVD